MRFRDAQRTVLKGLRLNISSMLVGASGIGKSQMVEQVARDYASELGLKLVKNKTNPSAKEFSIIDERASQKDITSTKGIPYTFVLDGVTYQGHAKLDSFPTSGRGLLFLDEFAQASPSVMAVNSQLLLEKRIGEYQLPKGWQVVVASNRAEDRAGSNKMLSQTIARGQYITVDVNFDDWFEYAVAKGTYNPYVLAFLSINVNALYEFDPRLIDAQPNPRSWERLSTLLNAEPKDDYSDYELLARVNVGEKESIQFQAFMDLRTKVPSLSDIVSGEVTKPTKKQISEMGLSYLTVIGLVEVIKEASEKVKESYFENALAYVENIGSPSFSIFFVRQMVTIDRSLMDTKIFVDFKVKNSEINF